MCFESLISASRALLWAGPPSAMCMVRLQAWLLCFCVLVVVSLAGSVAGYSGGLDGDFPVPFACSRLLSSVCCVHGTCAVWVSSLLLLLVFV